MSNYNVSISSLGTIRDLVVAATSENHACSVGLIRINQINRDEYDETDEDAVVIYVESIED